MAATVPDISFSMFLKIANVLLQWGEKHPLPDVAVITISDGSDITPREIARAMSEVINVGIKTKELGRHARTIRMLFSAAVFEEKGSLTVEQLISQLLEDFREDIGRWRGSPEPELAR